MLSPNRAALAQRLGRAPVTEASRKTRRPTFDGRQRLRTAVRPVLGELDWMISPKIPENGRWNALPGYAPELNPEEHVWDEM